MCQSVDLVKHVPLERAFSLIQLEQAHRGAKTLPTAARTRVSRALHKLNKNEFRICIE